MNVVGEAIPIAKTFGSRHELIRFTKGDSYGAITWSHRLCKDFDY